MSSEIKKEGKFSYVESGQGPTLLILHGLFGALSNFTEVLAHFSTSYRVIIPMLPIYDMPIVTTSVRALAKHLRQFIEFKELKGVHLLGNSLGGHVALVYSSKYGSNVASLILTGSSGLYENAFGGSFPRREDKEFIRQKVAVTFYDPKHATDALVNECYETVNDRGRLIRVLALAKSAIRHNMRKEISSMQMPSCLIWGKNDTITPPEVAEEFHELLPNSDLYWIDKCGHAPMMEHPDEFNQLLEGWLKERF